MDGPKTRVRVQVAGVSLRCLRFGPKAAQASRTVIMRMPPVPASTLAIAKGSWSMQYCACRPADTAQPCGQYFALMRSSCSFVMPGTLPRVSQRFRFQAPSPSQDLMVSRLRARSSSSRRRIIEPVAGQRT